jgi:hypothetical protein
VADCRLVRASAELHQRAIEKVILQREDCL